MIKFLLQNQTAQVGRPADVHRRAHESRLQNPPKTLMANRKVIGFRFPTMTTSTVKKEMTSLSKKKEGHSYLKEKTKLQCARCRD